MSIDISSTLHGQAKQWNKLNTVAIAVLGPMYAKPFYIHGYNYIYTHMHMCNALINT